MSRPALTELARRFAAVLAGFACGIASAGVMSAATADPGAAPVLQSLDRLPLQFEANRGQADPRFDFLARGPRHTIYLAPTETVVALHPARPDEDRTPRHPRRRGDSAEAVVRIALAGASPSPLTGEAGLPGTVNYFVGNEPAAWRTGIPTYRRVVGAEVYPGITVAYYGNGTELEFDFIVAPAARPDRIALQFDGAERIEIDSRGDLLVRVGGEVLRQHKPVAYQTIDGRRQEVRADFRLRDACTVVFKLGAYDSGHELVIDPVLSYVTYFGGSENDAIWAAAVDPAGRFYFAGTTISSKLRFPPATNVFQPKLAGRGRVSGDGFVARLNPAGTAFEFVTYLGGLYDDAILGLALDAAGNAYLTGYTDSTNFPALNAFQPAIGGTNDPLVNLPFTDAFVAKLDASGTALLYSTYLGGDGSEAGYSIAVDETGRAHVAGYTDSGLVFRATNEVCTTVCTNDFTGDAPVRSCGETKCVTDVVYVGAPLPFLTITNASSVVSNEMVVRTIETIVTTTLIGATQVNTVGFPVVNAIQRNNGGIASFKQSGKLTYSASLDGFVSTLSADGSALLASTYLGGFNDDQAFGIACDGPGNATVCGWTQSSDFPLFRPYQPALYGVQDAFVTRFDQSGSGLVYSTYLGGDQGDFANRVTLDASGNAYVVGSKRGNGFPSTPDAYNRGGVFVSLDSGGQWNPSSTGLAHPLVQALVFHPGAPSTIYAGTQRGVFKSTDGGSTWTSRSLGMQTLAVKAIAIDPVVPTVIYAGTVGHLYRSLDGGLTWLEADDGLRNTSLTAIAIDPLTNLTVYCGTRGGVFKSTNAAVEWSISSDGLANSQVNALVIDPRDTSVLYAATEGGVYKSTNSGVRWRSSNTGLSSKLVRALAMDPVDSALLYAGTTRGLFRSTNAGANWESLTNGLGRPFVTALAIDPLAPATVFAGTTNGIFRSTNGGIGWVVTTNGLYPRNVASLALDASTSPVTLHAGLWGTNSFGGTNDVFLVKLVPEGSALSYAVVFGGEQAEQGWDVAVDSFGAAAVVGQTTSLRFPVTNAPNRTQASTAGRTDAFVARLGPEARAFDYSFYLGGGGSDYGYAVAVDALANVYVAGTTGSGVFPTTNALQTKLAGGTDGFLAKVISPPTPAVVREAQGLTVSWPSTAAGFSLEASVDGGETWYSVSQPPIEVEGRKVVTLPTGNAGTRFRLIHP